MKRVEFRAGSNIVNQGEDGHTGYLIVSGSVLVHSGQDEQARTLRTLGAGEVFGEMCRLDCQSPRIQISLGDSMIEQY